MESFEQLKVWQSGMSIAIQVNKKFEFFKANSGFKDQITRSAISVPSNIAEGDQRGSIKDSIRFLYIAKGSAAELLTQIILAKELGYMSVNDNVALENQTREVIKMLASLIWSRKQRLE